MIELALHEEELDLILTFDPEEASSSRASSLERLRVYQQWAQDVKDIITDALEDE